MPTPRALEHNSYYHIFNRGVLDTNVFFEERNYFHFLWLYSKYIDPVADTYAWCLLKNHFHLLVRIKTIGEIEAFPSTPMGLIRRVTPHSYSRPNGFTVPSRQFSHLFNAYAKAINKAYDRRGKLFQQSFRRIKISNDLHFCNVVAYIHRNPQKHGFVPDFKEWKFSSFQFVMSPQATQPMKDMVRCWFGSKRKFLEHHATDSLEYAGDFLQWDDD